MVRAKRQMRDKPLNEGKARNSARDSGRNNSKYIRHETDNGVIYRLNIINLPQGIAYNTNRGELEKEVQATEEKDDTKKSNNAGNNAKSDNQNEIRQENIDGKVIYLSEQTAKRHNERKSRKTELKGHEIELLDGRIIYVENSTVAEAIRQNVERLRRAYKASITYQSPFKHTIVPDETYSNGPSVLSPTYLDDRLRMEITGLEPGDVRRWTGNDHTPQPMIPVRFDPVTPDRQRPKHRREPPVGLRYLYGEGNFARRYLQ